MAKKIDPKGISKAGMNGAPPKTAVRGKGINAKTVTNVPGASSDQRGNRSSEGATKRTSKGRRNTKGNESTLKTGKIPFGKTSGGSFPRTASTQAGTKSRGQKKFKP